MRTHKTKTISIVLLSVIAVSIIFSNIVSIGLAWEPSEMIVPAGTGEPTLDGIKSETEDWSSDTKCNTSLQVSIGGFPNAKLYAMSYSNYLYILFEVQLVSANDDQYVKLLLSNDTETDDDDFVDAKLVQNRNLTKADKRTFYIEDQHYDADTGTYLNDTSSDFSAVANVSGPNNYIYYEFKIPFGLLNDDNENDTSIFGGGSKYAIKIQYGVHPEGGTKTTANSPVLIMQIGVPPEEGDEDIGEYQIDMELLTNIMFIIAGVGFGAILVVSFQSRTKLK